MLKVQALRIKLKKLKKLSSLRKLWLKRCKF